MNNEAWTYDDWLVSLGLQFPENEKQLEIFEASFKDYSFRLDGTKINPDSIIEKHKDMSTGPILDEFLAGNKTPEGQLEKLKSRVYELENQHMQLRQVIKKVLEANKIMADRLDLIWKTIESKSE